MKTRYVSSLEGSSHAIPWKSCDTQKCLSLYSIIFIPLLVTVYQSFQPIEFTKLLSPFFSPYSIYFKMITHVQIVFFRKSFITRKHINDVNKFSQNLIKLKATHAQTYNLKMTNESSCFIIFQLMNLRKISPEYFLSKSRYFMKFWYVAFKCFLGEMFHEMCEISCNL